jgi:hypothetical protein
VDLETESCSVCACPIDPDVVLAQYVSEFALTPSSERFGLGTATHQWWTTAPRHRRPDGLAQARSDARIGPVQAGGGATRRSGGQLRLALGRDLLDSNVADHGFVWDGIGAAGAVSLG